jgi:Zn ribbon nucleic-acid-binding protein
MRPRIIMTIRCPRCNTKSDWYEGDVVPDDCVICDADVSKQNKQKRNYSHWIRIGRTNYELNGYGEVRCYGKMKSAYHDIDGEYYLFESSKHGMVGKYYKDNLIKQFYKE